MNTDAAELFLLSGGDEEVHSHSEIELIYIVDGECQAAVEDMLWHLQKDDVLLVNSNKKHRLMITSGALVCKIRLSYVDICSQLGENYIRFKCNSTVEYGPKYEDLRRKIQDVLLEYMNNDGRQPYRLGALFYTLISELLDHFKLATSAVGLSREQANDAKLSEILNYIEVNYAEPISLSEIAQKLFVSVSSLSRFFVKMTGQSFVHYLKIFRLEKAAAAVAQTDQPITRIAVEHGFSNPSAMNKDFKKYYGMAPLEYRKTYGKQAAEVPKVTCCPEKARLAELLGAQEKEASEMAIQRIEADIFHVSSYKKWHTEILNVGTPDCLELADMQQQLLTLKEQLDVEYIRIWSIFSKQLYIKESHLAPNFSKLDKMLDFCVGHNFKLFFDMGQRTKLAMANERKLIYYTEDGVEFDSREEWEYTLEAFIRHILNRYGESIVSQWIFEFSFFLNNRPYYRSDNYSSRQVWESGYKIVKKYIPAAAVAGPGLSVILDNELTAAVIHRFLDTPYPPDIFTSFNFPYRQTGEPQKYEKLAERNFLQRQIELVQSILKEYDFAGKYYVTDWNNSLANRNFIQDSCYRGTFILKNVLDNYEAVDGMGIFYASDLINVYYDADSVLTGSGGILSKDGGNKPAYYAYKFLNEMGRCLIKKGENYLITKNSDRDLQILFFNNKNLGPNYYLAEEDVYKPQELHKLFQNHDTLHLSLTLSHLSKNSTYVVREKIINQQNGSLLDKWLEMGGEKALFAEDIEYLKNMAIPAIKVWKVPVVDGKITLDILLMPHEMRWISIREA